MTISESKIAKPSVMAGTVRGSRLSRFLHRLSTDWSDPEETEPLSSLEHLGEIFRGIDRVARQTCEPNEICPDEGQLAVVWRTSDRTFMLHMDTETVQAEMLMIYRDGNKNWNNRIDLTDEENWDEIAENVS